MSLDCYISDVRSICCFWYDRPLRASWCLRTSVWVGRPCPSLIRGRMQAVKIGEAVSQFIELLNDHLQSTSLQRRRCEGKFWSKRQKQKGVVQGAGLSQDSGQKGKDSNKISRRKGFLTRPHIWLTENVIKRNDDRRQNAYMVSKIKIYEKFKCFSIHPFSRFTEFENHLSRFHYPFSLDYVLKCPIESMKGPLARLFPVNAVLKGPLKTIKGPLARPFPANVVLEGLLKTIKKVHLLDLSPRMLF